MIRARLAVATLLLVAVAPPPARGNARAETEEARIADILQSTLVKHGGEVNRCFEKALADTMDVSGKIELAVDIGEGGRVTKAAPASDGVKSPVLLACLTESAATWTLVGIDPGSTVIVPLAFEGQAAQFSVKVKDAPDHGPPAPPSKKKGSPAPTPPFTVKLLVDEATMRAQKAALTQLTIGARQPDRDAQAPRRRGAVRAQGPRARAGPVGRRAREAGRRHGDPDPGRHAARDREHGAHVLRRVARRVRADGPRARLPRSEGRRGARRVRGDPRRRAGGSRRGEVHRRVDRGRRDAAGRSRAKARSNRSSTRRRPATRRCTSASWRRTRAPWCRATPTPDRRRSCTSCRARATS